MRSHILLALALAFVAHPALAAKRFKDVEFPVTVTRAIVYSTGGIRAPASCEKEMLLDLYEPQIASNPPVRPAIVVLHGGAFRAGDRDGAESLADLCEELAARGYVCASIDYRLEGDDPEAEGATLRERTLNAVVEDAADAFRWLRRNAATHHIDRSRMALGGASAGAVAVLRLAYSDEGRALGIRAVLDLSGRMNGSLEAIQPHDAPLLVIHGTNDTLVRFDDAVAVVNRAKAVGLPHRFVFGEGKANGHIRRLRLEIMGATVLDHIVEFFYQYLALADL